MRTVVRKWGNSVAVRIPAAVIRAANLDPDQEVDIREEGGCIVISPVRPVPHALAPLLGGITGDNLHEEVLTGDVVDRESW